MYTLKQFLVILDFCRDHLNLTVLGIFREEALEKELKPLNDALNLINDDSPESITQTKKLWLENKAEHKYGDRIFAHFLKKGFQETNILNPYNVHVKAAYDCFVYNMMQHYIFFSKNYIQATTINGLRSEKDPFEIKEIQLLLDNLQKFIGHLIILGETKSAMAIHNFLHLMHQFYLQLNKQCTQASKATSTLLAPCFLGALKLMDNLEIPKDTFQVPLFQSMNKRIPCEFIRRLLDKAFNENLFECKFSPKLYQDTCYDNAQFMIYLNLNIEKLWRPNPERFNALSYQTPSNKSAVPQDDSEIQLARSFSTLSFDYPPPSSKKRSKKVRSNPPSSSHFQYELEDAAPPKVTEQITAPDKQPTKTHESKRRNTFSFFRKKK